MKMRILSFAITIVSLLIAPIVNAQFAIFQASSATPAVVCTFTAGNCVGAGGGSGLFTAGTCNGSTDDTTAFHSFASWATGTWQASHSGQIELFIPSGKDCVFSNESATTFAGINNLLVSGYGASLNGTYYHLAGDGQYEDNMHSTRLLDVVQGATSVTVNPSSSSQPAACSTLTTCVNLFTVGEWALLAGFDLQGGGNFPTNPFYFEYVLVTGKNTSTGVVTFASPTAYAYKSTWPNYGFTGDVNHIDPGGPATLYALHPSWNTTVEWRGITFNRDTGCGAPCDNQEIDGAGRSFTVRDTTWTLSGPNTCLFGTANASINIINSTMTNCQMEFDKLVASFVFSGSTISVINFQSASAGGVGEITSSTAFNISGTPNVLTISSSTISGTLTPGPSFYGYAKSLSIANSSINLLAPGGFIYSGTNDEGLNNIGSSFTMSGGIITIARSYMASGANQLVNHSWFAPGANLCWADDTYNCAGVFQVTDVTADATNIYVHTNWAGASGGFPSWTYIGSGLKIRVHPAPAFTCDASCFAYGGGPTAPLFSYNNVTWQNSFGTGFPVYLWGNITSITANVTTHYGGTTSPATDSIFTSGAINPSTFTSNDYSGVSVNLALPTSGSGLRSLTVSGFPSSWTGGQSGDTLPALTSQTWSTGQFYNTLTDLSGDPSNQFRINTIVTTNQGVVVP